VGCGPPALGRFLSLDPVRFIWRTIAWSVEEREVIAESFVAYGADAWRRGLPFSLWNAFGVRRWRGTRTQSQFGGHASPERLRKFLVPPRLNRYQLAINPPQPSTSDLPILLVFLQHSPCRGRQARRPLPNILPGPEGRHRDNPKHNAGHTRSHVYPAIGCTRQQTSLEQDVQPVCVYTWQRYLSGKRSPKKHRTRPASQIS